MYLEFANICKSFPGVKALDGISFGVKEGSIHALMGENGAGKSTLLKILSGAYQPTSGNMVINGRPHVFHDTSQALDAGVAVIYQELHLVPEMSVAENLFLGHMPARLGVIGKRELRQKALSQLELIGENINPDTKLGRLPLGQRQMVEIAKALTRGAKIIAFDEPTSSLSDREIKKLFSIIRDLRMKGHVILYVSHRMREIFELSDTVTVFRDGKHVATFDDMSKISHDILVKCMVGRDIRNVYNYSPRPFGSSGLEVEGITGKGVPEPAGFVVAKGEILGFFGLVGAGRSELMKLVFGAVPKRSGSIRIDGNTVPISSPKDAIANGLMFCPEDRKAEGIVPVRSVMENLNLSARRIHSHFRFIINEKWERSNAEEKRQRLAVKTPSLQQLIRNLSGGNQQKVILARWLSEDIKVIIFDEPTRGIDVGAKSEIYNIIFGLAGQGVAVVVVSSDLPELMGVSDRMLVMRGGAVSGELKREEFSEEKILNLALPTEPAD